MTGFRFALLTSHGEPHDPGVFVTALPDWWVGDPFRSHIELRKSSWSQPGRSPFAEFRQWREGCMWRRALSPEAH